VAAGAGADDLKPTPVVHASVAHLLEPPILRIGELEAQVGAKPAAIDLKVIDHLDTHARRWLAASPLAFAGFSDAKQVSITIAGGQPAFATAPDDRRLRLALADLDDPGLVAAGKGIGLLFLVPGLGETLRVNGVVSTVDDEACVVDVQECYAHCAKALLRSDFWRPGAIAEPTDFSSFPGASRFLALATADSRLHTDVSPKGDPAGFLVQPFDDGIRFADRPGNRRTDSMRNVISRPDVAALLVVPGHTHVMIAQGVASLHADLRLREAFAVQDKIPKLVVALATSALALRESAVLSRVRPWSEVRPPPPDLDPAAIFAAHVRLNKTRGLHAAIAKKVVAFPGLMRLGLAKDYKRNLY